MPTIHLEAQVSPDELLKAVDQLGLADLDRFVSHVLALLARRRGPSLPAEEADLLLEINRGIPAEVRARLDELDARREAETLTPAEHEELLSLIARVEELEGRRVERLSRLAQLRGVSLSALMDTLGIHSPNHE
jgi:hypothetical protein